MAASGVKRTLAPVAQNRVSVVVTEKKKLTTAVLETSVCRAISALKSGAAACEPETEERHD